MPLTPSSGSSALIYISICLFAAVALPVTHSLATDSLPANSATADTVAVPVSPTNGSGGTATVAFQAPVANATNGTTSAIANDTAATSNKQQQPEQTAAHLPSTSKSDSATTAANNDNSSAQSVSLPNEPISEANALLMHAQFEKVLQSEAHNFTAAGSDIGIYQGLFDAHNQYRVRHQGAIYTWNPTLASNAAGYASRCIFAHDPNRNCNGGENIYVTTSKDVSYALGQTPTLWYAEISDYDFNTGGALYGHPSMIGHFTQMVWLGSSMIGCAAAVCNYGITNFQPGTIVVCRYSPAGNVIGQYTQNVRPATSYTSTPTYSSIPAYAPPPPPPPSASSSSQNLATVVATQGQNLAGPGCRSSPDQRYWLCVWDNGEAIFYQGQTPRWRTNTAGSGPPFKLVVWNTGNMYLDNAYSQFVWQSSSGRGTPPHRLLLQNDGRLVLYDANNYAIWSVS